MSALVRITTGIMPQHSRVGMTRAMTQFGEVIHCHKPPYAGIPGEDFVNVRFASQDAADKAYAALKNGQVFVDGFQVGVGPTPGAGKGGGGDALALGNGQFQRRRSPSPPRHYGRNVAYRQRSPPRRRPSPRRRSPSMGGVANFPSRNTPKSPSPRRLAREMHMTSGRAPSRSRSRGSPMRDRGRRYREERMNEFSGGMPSLPGLPPKKQERPARTPSPDPPGPVKNLVPVKNPFFKSRRSPTPDLYEPEKDSSLRGGYFEAPAFEAM